MLGVIKGFDRDRASLGISFKANKIGSIFKTCVLCSTLGIRRVSTEVNG